MTDTDINPKPRPSKSGTMEARLIVEFFRAAKYGDSITYDEISQLIGCDVRHGGYKHLARARQILRDQDLISLETLISVGVRKRFPREKVEANEARNNRTRTEKTIGLAELKMPAEEFVLLKPEERCSISARQFRDAAILELTTNRATKRIKDHFAGHKTEMDVRGTLALFAREDK